MPPYLMAEVVCRHRHSHRPRFRYADITADANTDHVIVRFFGVFFLFFQSSSVFGNIISSTVLKGVEEETNTSTIGLDFGNVK